MEKYILISYNNSISVQHSEETYFDLKYIFREIEDPEKQRKMEERENRREKKKAQPKMKQLKVN